MLRNNELTKFLILTLSTGVREEIKNISRISSKYINHGTSNTYESQYIVLL